jgi:alkylation response protein AidB-like acyl-CoA dehydrogenase
VRLSLAPGLAELRERARAALARGGDGPGGEAAAWRVLDEAVAGYGMPSEAGDERLLAAVVVCEEAGRGLCARPLRSTLAARCLGLAEPARWSLLSLPGDGLLHERPRFRRLGAGRWEATGVLSFVEHGPAGARVVTAAEQGPPPAALVQIDLDQRGLEDATLPSLDVTRPVHRLALQGAAAAEVAAGDVGTGRLLGLARLLVAAELLGAAARLYELALGYARSRHQFGRPIAEFQAVSHACADAYTELEMIRSLVYAAAARGRGGGGGRGGEAAAGGRAADLLLQVFGASGLVWESETNLLVRRIRALRPAYGDQFANQELVLAGIPDLAEAGEPLLHGSGAAGTGRDRGVL